jgi:hypothetical protein
MTITEVEQSVARSVKTLDEPEGQEFGIASAQDLLQEVGSLARAR